MKTLCTYTLLFATWVAVPFSLAQSETQRLDAKIEALRRDYEGRISELQGGYERRIRSLEGEVGALRGELGEVGDIEAERALERAVNSLVVQEERRGLAEFSQTTLFENNFNPAFSVVGDFILSGSDRDDSFEDLNQFHLRAVELGVYGRVDPNVAYYFVVHFDEEEIELEEAYAWWDDGLPSTFTLRGGRYNVDFGKLSAVHDHDLPFVDKPAVLQDYLGGALRGTGLELHHWFPVGDSHLIRWSVGIVNEFSGDTHPIVGPAAGDHHHEDEEGPEPFGEREFESFGFNGRLTGLFELGSETTLQAGASVAYSPEARRFFFDGMMNVGEAELEQTIVGFDLTFVWKDEETGKGLTVGGEFLASFQDFLDEDSGALSDEDALGFYVYGEFFINSRWSVGASVNWLERAEDPSAEWFDVGGWVSWRANEFNRLRLELRYFDDELGEDETFFVAMLQWTVIIGSHGHGVDW